MHIFNKDLILQYGAHFVISVLLYIYNVIIHRSNSICVWICDSLISRDTLAGKFAK